MPLVSNGETGGWIDARLLTSRFPLDAANITINRKKWSALLRLIRDITHSTVVGN